MSIQEYVEELRDAGVPLKEAVSRAREELARRQEIQKENNRKMNARRRD